MRAIIRTPQAEQDTDDILDRLSARNPATAARFAAEVAARCALLAGQPNMGRPRDDLSPGLRSVVIDRHILFYRATDDAVTVVRILHGSQDIAAQVWDD